MISHGKDVKVFSGNANPKLAEEICKLMGTKLGESEVGTFSDGEIFVSLYETVRGSDVFVVQSTCTPVNNNLMELLIMIDALKRASAGRITAVIPYFGYARQDRKAKARDPITAKLVANMITAAGADRVLTMDLHAAQIQGFFDIPVDNLAGNPIFVDYYAKKFGTDCENMMVVSPDVGSVARARAFAQKLHMNLAPPSNASTTAASRSWPCWIPFPPLIPARVTRSSICPWPICLPRPLSASIRKFPFPSCSAEALLFCGKYAGAKIQFQIRPQAGK